MLVLKKDRNLHAAMRILRIFEFVFLFFLRRAGLGRGMSARGEKSGYRRLILLYHTPFLDTTVLSKKEACLIHRGALRYQLEKDKCGER